MIRPTSEELLSDDLSTLQVLLEAWYRIYIRPPRPIRKEVERADRQK